MYLKGNDVDDGLQAILKLRNLDDATATIRAHEASITLGAYHNEAAFTRLQLLDDRLLLAENQITRPTSNLYEHIFRKTESTSKPYFIENRTLSSPSTSVCSRRYLQVASRVAMTMIGRVSSTNAKGPCFISPAKMPSLCIRATSFTFSAPSKAVA